MVSFGGQGDIPIIITENKSCEERQVKEVKMSWPKADKILGKKETEFSHV
jgi:hypothetical protein